MEYHPDKLFSLNSILDMLADHFDYFDRLLSHDKYVVIHGSLLFFFIDDCLLESALKANCWFYNPVRCG